MVHYKKNEIPTSYITENEVLIDTFIHFDFLHTRQEETRQLEIEIRNSKKQLSPLDKEILSIKETYKSLSGAAKKSTFIANLIFKITK